MLTGYAESDFVPRKSATDSTFGVFQQNPRWWPTAQQGTAAQCGAFLDAFARIKRFGSGAMPPGQQSVAVVSDCWQVQNWTMDGQPTPRTDLAAWGQLPNTANYLSRVATVATIITTGRIK